MKMSELILSEDRDYRPKPVARLWGGYNGRKIPDELKKFMSKHVKTTSDGRQYVNQYPDQWYFTVFSKTPDIKTFDSFFAVIKPYFSVQRIQEL